MAITEDASTPASPTTGTGAGVLTTGSFSPPAATLLVALACGGWSSTGTVNVTIADSGSHTWTQGAKAQGAVASNFGVAAVYYCYLASAPGSITVSATYTGLSGGRFLAVRVLNGAAASQTGAGSATFTATSTSTTASVAITTTTANSLVYGASDAATSSTTFTPNGATTQIGTTNSNTTDGIACAAWRATSATGTPGATTLGGTWGAAEDGSVAAFEVLPAVVGGGGTNTTQFLPFFS